MLSTETPYFYPEILYSPEIEIVPERMEKAHNLECVVSGLEILVRQQVKDTPFVIRISGYSALGKSTLARALGERLGAAIVQTDGYMLDRETRKQFGLTNGDDPRTIDFAGMRLATEQLASGNRVRIPQYNHKTGRHDEEKEIVPSNIIIIEGASALYDEFQPPFPGLKIFIDADEAVKIQLRHDVNVHERGYTEEQFQQALPGYLAAYATYIQPTLKNADHVLRVTKERQYQAKFIQECLCSPS